MRHPAAIVLATSFVIGCVTTRADLPPRVELPPPPSAHASAAPPPTVAPARVCVPIPPSTPSPLLLDFEGTVIEFLDGSCANDPVCMKRWTDSDRPAWALRLTEPDRTRFPLAAGEFGPPGGGPIRGPAWQLYFVHAVPPAIGTRDGWTADIDGTKAYVIRGYENEFGSFVTEVMLFEDQLPGTAKHTVTLRGCAGEVIARRTIELVDRHPF